MSIIDSLKRLERAGSENSQATEKLRKAAAEVAARIEAQAPVGVDLPRGYWVGHVKSNVGGALFLFADAGVDEFGERAAEMIDGWDGFLHGDFHCQLKAPSREAVLKFARDVAEGWLDEVAAFLEARAAQEAAAAATLDNARPTE